MTIKALMIGTAAMFGCISVACVGCGPGRTARADKPSHGMLKGLRAEPLWMTRVGGLIGAAKYLKLDASPAWIYGATGHAFALNIHEVVCPSGPTAWCAEKCDELAANIGIVVEDYSQFKGSGDFAAGQERIWRNVCAAIDVGLPAFGWELDVPEWYVVRGYDADGHYLFADLSGGSAKTHYTKLGDTGIGVTSIRVVKRGKPAEDRVAVREALLFAIEHAAGKHSRELWRSGLPGYETWIKALSANKAEGSGQAYNAQCWAECRRNAVAFLEEAAKRLDDEHLAPLFADTIARYKTVSARLDAVAKAFPFDVADEQAMADRIKDESRRAAAVRLLQAARDTEAAGVETLQKIVELLRGQTVEE